MKIVVTAQELLDKGLWGDACELLGLNEWAVNEGLMDSDEELTLTEEQAKTLGLIKGDDNEDQ